jgi:o-succinylbenzoate synthase
MKLRLRRAQNLAPAALSAKRSYAERDSVIVLLEDEGGACGFGEAAPLPGYSPDDLERAAASLSAVAESKLESAFERGSALETLRGCAELVSPRCPAARFALETAALDLLGKQRALPAPSLLGAAPRAERELACLLGRASDAQLLDRAEYAIRLGFCTLKLKIASGDGRELEAVAELRRRVGTAVALRLDANRGLSSRVAHEFCRQLEPHGIELFEEPCTDALHELPIPLALDESLQGLSPSAALARLLVTRARAAVLKPTTLGGVSHCFDLAHQLAPYGIAAVASHAFEGPIAQRAIAALALALPPALAHGLGPAQPGAAAMPAHTPMLRAWDAPGLALEHDAHLLGLELDRAP